MILAVKVREHDFMGEERRPFKGFGAAGRGGKMVMVVKKLCGHRLAGKGVTGQGRAARLRHWRNGEGRPD
jgi:hypothetical protein